MEINWAKVVPVIVSVLIIIAVAIVQEYSRTIAAITTVMPIKIPLSLWVVSAGTGKTPRTLPEFTGELVINIVPTIVFLLAGWQIAKAGYGLMPIIIGGFIAWGGTMALIFFVRQSLGF